MKKLKADQSAVGVARGAVASDLVSDRFEVTSPRIQRGMLEGRLHYSRTKCLRDDSIIVMYNRCRQQKVEALTQSAEAE